MTLTDPREDLAAQSSFVGYLVGIAGLAQVVRTLAAPDADGAIGQPGAADDFVHVLLGVASLGDAIQGIVKTTGAKPVRASDVTSVAPVNARWLR